MKTYAVISAALLGAMVCSAVQAADTIPRAIFNAVNSYGRPHAEIIRDNAMKPADVLAFAGVKPRQVVVDLTPGAGYYTRILAMVVGPKGAVYDMVPLNEGNTYEQRRGTLVKDITQNRPMARVDLAFGLEDQPEFKNITVFWENVSQLFALPRQADVVITDGGYHFLKGAEFTKADTLAMNKLIFETMKSGGVYLVIDNQAAKGKGFTDAGLNRVEADAVKREALAAGFVLDGESTILAKSDDDHTKPADANADRFMLRFKKPENAPDSDMRPDARRALAGYFGNTRRGNVGDPMERRVMYHEDLSYEEYGTLKSGASPFQSGLIFYRADGQGCMLHKFPSDQKGQVNCSNGRAVPNMKAGDKWNGADDNRPYWLVPGLQYFDE